MPENKLTTFYIVRHGETDWNVKKILQGHTDIPLNNEGESQARRIAQELSSITFDQAYSSDLMRARQTAEIIALEHKLAVQSTEILRERMFGKFEGQPYKERETYFKLLGELTHEQRLNHKMSPDIESDKEVVTRLFTFLREIAIAFPGKIILITTHGGPIHVILRYLGIYSYKDKVKTENTAYIKLLSDDVDFFVEELKGINLIKKN